MSASNFISLTRRTDLTVVGGYVWYSKRRRAGEALVPHQLFGVEAAALRLPERDVALLRDRAQRVIDRHRSIPVQVFPRSSCSRSIASNSALKLPSPKLFAPLRWMIS